MTHAAHPARGTQQAVQIQIGPRLVASPGLAKLGCGQFDTGGACFYLVMQRGAALMDRLWEGLHPYLLPLLLSLLGLLSRRAFDVREGKTPRFFDRTLPLDLLIFTPGVLGGMALNEQFAITGNSAAFVMVVVGYFGWRTIMVWAASFKGLNIDLEKDKAP